jgi:DNA polymerase-3 subunit beta
LSLASIGYERGSAEETLTVTYQGEGLEIALNAGYLIDALQVLECDQVELQLRDSNTQCVVVPVNDDARLEEYIYVLMPMRL